MAVISIHFTDGIHRTAKTSLLCVFPISKYAAWFYNESVEPGIEEPIAYPKNISMREADAVFDGLMQFHQNGLRTQKDLAHFLIDHGCRVSRLPSGWNGDGWNGYYCNNLNVEIL